MVPRLIWGFAVVFNECVVLCQELIELGWIDALRCFILEFIVLFLQGSIVFDELI